MASANANVVKIPVVIEMNENADGERLEVPQRAHELLPVAEPGEYGVVVVLGEGGHLVHHFLGGPLRAALGPLWGGGQPRPPAGRGHLRLLRDPGPEQREAGGGQRREGSGVLRVSVRTAVRRSSVQTRCTAISPSLLESAST